MELFEVIRRGYAAGETIQGLSKKHGVHRRMVRQAIGNAIPRERKAVVREAPYGRPGASTIFDFCMGRGREGPKQFLGKYGGILQTDGYAGYDRVGGLEMVHAGCWAHSRRKFYEAAKLHPADAAATRMVARINELFAIDAGAREQKLDHAARHQLRQQEAAPLLKLLHIEIKAALHQALPASALGGACNYTLALWQKLTRFLDHPELELSNNLAENSMRPIALGRKNWIHVGSQQAGPKIAAILSVIETCRRLHHA